MRSARVVSSVIRMMLGCLNERAGRDFLMPERTTGRAATKIHSKNMNP